MGRVRACRATHAGTVDEHFARAQHLEEEEARMTDRVSQLEAILAENPSDAMARYALAMEFMNAGQLETAIMQFRLLLNHHPGHVAAYQMLAQAMMRKGLTVEARDVLVKGMEVAAAAGNEHAQSEMHGMLQELGA